MNSKETYRYGYIRTKKDNQILNNEIYLYDDSGNTRFALIFTSNDNNIPHIVDIPINILPITDRIEKTEYLILNPDTDSLIYGYIKEHEKIVKDIE